MARMNMRILSFRIAGLIFGLGLVFMAWKLATRERVQQHPGQFAEYYRTEISPLIDSAEARQQQAVDLALARLHEHFETFRRGVPNFTKDITQWGTRFGIVGRGISDLWTQFWNDTTKAVAVQTYTDEKFRAWVVNEGSLQQALDDASRTFIEAMEASRNRLEGEIKLAIGRPDCPLRIPAPDFEQYLKSAAMGGRGLAVQAGKDSAISGGAGFIGGGIAGAAAEGLVTAIIARLTAASVATSAAAGSATAAGAAAGGGGGSAAGPLGTIIGFGVGIAVGAIVDWWMTDKFKEKLSTQCTTFLDELENDLMNGVGGKPGLKALLTQAARDESAKYRNALFAELQKASLK